MLKNAFVICLEAAKGSFDFLWVWFQGLSIISFTSLYYLVAFCCFINDYFALVLSASRGRQKHENRHLCFILGKENLLGAELNPYPCHTNALNADKQNKLLLADQTN